MVAFAGAQLRPRRVGVNPMGEETGAAEAGGAEPDMADLMKNMMGGIAARPERSKQPSRHHPPLQSPTRLLVAAFGSDGRALPLGCRGKAAEPLPAQPNAAAAFG